MFSGLVREFGKVRSYSNNVLCLESTLHPKIGDSVAINGVCLSAISSDMESFCVELTLNTAKSIAVENLKGLVHIESALKLQDGLHGHIVQGHIDSIGVIKSIAMQGNGCVFHISAPARTLEMMIDKGSVCVDGISLTINAISVGARQGFTGVVEGSMGATGRSNAKYNARQINATQGGFFELVIIPHTMQNTLFSTYKVGRRVNIETDIIVRTVHFVVERMYSSDFPNRSLKSGGLDSRDSQDLVKGLTQEICDSITLGY